jgi:hypothetical protein
LIAGTQACQRQGRIFAAGDEQAQLRRLVFDCRSGLRQPLRVEQVIIIEDENQRCLEPVEGSSGRAEIEQGSQ